MNMNQTKTGFFGKGIYFTQSPSYCSEYATDGCLMLSWVLLGRSYPVVEHPDPKAQGSLYGKPCKGGFNSHYVVVKEVSLIF